MKRLLPAAAILALLILPQVAQAQTNQLAKVNEIHVTVNDGIKDGCLPSPNILKVEAELVLRRSGIRVSDELGDSVHQLEITTNGKELTIGGGRAPSGECVAAVSFQLGRWELLANGTAGFIQADNFLNSYYGPKGSFQNEIRVNINEMATILANEILKARAAR